MRKHNYRVKLEADFIEPASTPSQLKGRLMQVIKRAGLGETNFSIFIEREEEPARYNLDKGKNVSSKLGKGNAKKL